MLECVNYKLLQLAQNFNSSKKLVKKMNTDVIWIKRWKKKPFLLLVKRDLSIKKKKEQEVRRENQIQCPCTTRQHHIILYSTVSTMQHPFQLYLQRSHLCSFYTCDWLARTIGDNKKKDILPPFVKVEPLLFFIQYGYANFSCVLQP